MSEMSPREATELARARAQLVSAQHILHTTRIHAGAVHLLVDRSHLEHFSMRASASIRVDNAIDDFLAALSWVWDAQERASA